jgi:hypothetical protein
MRRFFNPLLTNSRKLTSVINNTENNTANIIVVPPVTYTMSVGKKTGSLRKTRYKTYGKNDNLINSGRPC